MRVEHGGHDFRVFVAVGAGQAQRLVVNVQFTRRLAADRNRYAVRIGCRASELRSVPGDLRRRRRRGLRFALDSVDARRRQEEARGSGAVHPGEGHALDFVLEGPESRPKPVRVRGFRAFLARQVGQMDGCGVGRVEKNEVHPVAARRLSPNAVGGFAATPVLGLARRTAGEDPPRLLEKDAGGEPLGAGSVRGFRRRRFHGIDVRLVFGERLRRQQGRQILGEPAQVRARPKAGRLEHGGGRNREAVDGAQQTPVVRIAV